MVEKGVRKQKGLPGRAGLCWPSLCKPGCSPGRWDWDSSLQLSVLLLRSRADLFWATQGTPEASQHAHPQAALSCCPQPSTARLLLTAVRAPHALRRTSGKFSIYKITGSKSLISRIFLIIFWIFTLSLLQVLFQSSSIKKVVWGSIHFYFRSTFCPGI